MPDRYGEDPAPIPSRQESEHTAREASESAKRIAEIGRLAGIGRCGLCNSDGYRGGNVCDHVDHQDAARRGMDMIRETMGWQS